MSFYKKVTFEISVLITYFHLLLAVLHVNSNFNTWKEINVTCELDIFTSEWRTVYLYVNETVQLPTI